MAPSAGIPPFVHVSVPNRSLGTRARRWILGAIGATTFGVAAGAGAIGAWPVMPFAGFEVALLVLAFGMLERHAADFERLEIDEHRVRFEARVARGVTRFEAHRPWTRLEVWDRGARCTLRLASGGRSVAVGRLLSDEGRRQLAGELRRRIAVRAN